MATKDSYFVFNGLLYKQTDSVPKRSLVGPSPASPFLSCHEKKTGSIVFHMEIVFSFLPTLCLRYFFPLRLNDHLMHFQNFLNYCPINMSFSTETEIQTKLSCPNVEVIVGQAKFKTIIYINLSHLPSV